MYSERYSRVRKAKEGNSLAVPGVILGTGIGAALALIYSPGTGKQNRKQLSDWAHRQLDVVQRKLEGVVKR
jgi:gas vesicle protein